MFADAGAEVVKIESPQGDSLRSWSAGGPAGALFGYLAAGKKSVICRRPGGGHGAAGRRRRRAHRPDRRLDARRHHGAHRPVGGGRGGDAVRDDGPLRRRPASPPTNSSCRRCAARPPAAAGRTTNPSRRAAGSASGWRARSPRRSRAAAARHAARGGRGEIVDVSTYEAMVIAMGGLSGHVGQRAGRGFPYPATQSGTAVDRPHRRRHGRLLHHHRAAVPGLSGDDRSRRPGRRRRTGLVRRADRAPRRIPRHGHPVDRRPAPRRRSSISRWRSEFRWPPSRPRPRCRPSTTSCSAACSSNRSSGCCSRGCRIAATRSRPGRPEPARRCWAPTTAASHWPPSAPAASAADPDALPLSDIRITDFTAFWAGPGRHPIPRRAGRRRDQARGRSPARRHEVLRRPPTRLGPVVGVGPGFPVQQQQQARHQRRAQHRSRTGHRFGAHRRKRSRHRELLAEGDGELRPGLGRRGGRQPARDHGPDAGVRPRRPVARPRRLRADDGAGDRNGVDDRAFRRTRR